MKIGIDTVSPRVDVNPDNATNELSPDGSVVHRLIAGAAHHQDLRFADPSDGADLIAARAEELAYVTKWLAEA